MPSNVSEVYIANLALAKICSKAITALSDTTVEARWCNRFFAQCRDKILRSHPWNFAIKRQTLSELSTVPINEWAHQYALPSDYINIYQLNGTHCWNSTYLSNLYQIEAGNILTNAETAVIRYVFQQDDASKYDPLFVEAFADLLASQICQPITGNPGTSWLQVYETVSLKKAMRQDAREDKPRVVSPIEQSELVRRRFYSDIG